MCGSSFHVSITVCDSRPERRASIRSSSTTIPPREVLTNTAPGFIDAKKLASAMAFVG